MNEHPITKEALLQGELYAQLLEEELRKARAPRDFEKCIRNVHCTLDRVFVESLAQSGDRIACKAGCSFCCHLKVDALAIEVFSLVEHIGSHLTEKERDLIHAKANANRQRITLMTCEEQQLTNIACPLLSPDGCCMCYVFRPAICRK